MQSTPLPRKTSQTTTAAKTNQTKPNKLYHLKKYWVLYLILGLILTGTIWDYIKPRLVDNAGTSTQQDSTRPPTPRKTTNRLGLIDDAGIFTDNQPDSSKQKSRDLFNNKNQTPKPLSKQDINKKRPDFVDIYDNKTQTSAKLPVLENNPQQTPKVKTVKDIWHETISDPEFKALDFSSKRRVVDGFMEKFIIPDAGYQALPEERKANILHQFERDAGIANDTELVGSYFKQGKDKYDLQDFTGAIKDYSKLIELNPKYAAAYFYRGCAKVQLQDFTGAVQDYNKAIELDPKYSEAYYMRGCATESLKDKQGALKDYSKAGELGYTEACVGIQRIQKGN